MTALQTIKRIIVAPMGGTVLIVGLALIVLPGPALPVIPAGLAILALELNSLLQTARAAVAATGRKAPLDRTL